MRTPSSASRCFLLLFLFWPLLILPVSCKHSTSLHVELSWTFFDAVIMTCSENSPDPFATFRYMKLMQLNGTGHRIVWATLKRNGRPELSQTELLDIMGTRSMEVGGGLGRNSRQLHLIVFNPTLDIYMRNSGEFSCEVSYHEPEKESRIGSPLKLIPGMTQPMGDAGFTIRHDHVVDVICRVTIPTLANVHDITINIVRLSDQALLGSWMEHFLLACPSTPKAACSGLVCQEEVCYVQVRLMGEEQGEDYQCSVQDRKGEKRAFQVISATCQSTPSSSSTQWCGAFCAVLAVVMFVVGVFFLPVAKRIVALRRQKLTF